jgi:hypothetical protein
MRSVLGTIRSRPRPKNQKTRIDHWATPSDQISLSGIFKLEFEFGSDFYFSRSDKNGKKNTKEEGVFGAHLLAALDGLLM